MDTKMILAVVVSLAVGAGAMWAWTGHREPEPDIFPKHEFMNDDFIDDLFNDDFFRHSRDPFREMDRLQKEMDRYFSNDGFSSRFGHWFSRRFGGFPASSIRMEEDRDHIYYRIDTNGLEVRKADVRVENDMVSIQVEMGRNTGTRQTSSTISQQFPLPPAVDPDSVKLEIEDDEIVVRLTRLKDQG